MTGAHSATANRVVLWEDDPVRQPLLAAILETSGIPISRPADPETALALAASPETSALVLDANVTRPSGTEFLRQVCYRRHGPPPPTVVLLQPGQACLRLAMRELGAARVIHEPFDPARLLSAVRDLAASGGEAA